MEEGNNVQVADKHSSVNVDIGLENGGLSSLETHDQLVQTIMELRLQNDYFKSQVEGLNDSQLLDQQAELREMIDSLNKQLVQEKQTRVAAEEALKHLQVAHSEADAKAQDLSLKLLQGPLLFSSFFSSHQQYLTAMPILRLSACP